MRQKLKFLYGFAGGFYTYSIFALLFWETRRSDFGISMSHHIATLMLIVFSYLAKLARVGSVVLAVHDASDVFLEIGKMTKYSGLEIIPSISFLLFAISWLVLRLIIFPFMIIRSTSYECLKYLDRTMAEGPVYYYVFNTLLITLQVMHIYWWVLIWRMIVRQIQDRGKLSDDVRSDSDSDSDSDDDSDDEDKNKKD
uniref:TLC domain-containing protein n=1 Tax=Physcomitrium patens TaxID=3218 RepID=A0A7I4DVY1_PHYPA